MWTVPQPGGVVPGPRLATPDTSQDKTQQHHHAQPLRPDTDHFLQFTITANIDRDYLSLNTPDISSFNNLCSRKIGFIQPQKLDLTQ